MPTKTKAESRTIRFPLDLRRFLPPVPVPAEGPTPELSKVRVVEVPGLLDDADYLPSRLGLVCPNRDCASCDYLLVSAGIAADPENSWNDDARFACDGCGRAGRLRHLKRPAGAD